MTDQTAQAQHQIEQQNVAYNRQLAYLLYVFPSYPLFTIKNVFDACNCIVTAAYRVLENHTSTMVREQATNSTEMNERSWMSSQHYGSALPSVSSVPISSYFPGPPLTTYAFCDTKASGSGNMQSQVVTSYPIPSYTSGICASSETAETDTRVDPKPQLPVTTVSHLDSRWCSSPVSHFNSASNVDRGNSTSTISVLGVSSFCVSSDATESNDTVSTVRSKAEQTTHDAAAALIQLTVKSATGLSN